MKVEDMEKGTFFTALFLVFAISGCYHRPQAVLTIPHEGQEQTQESVLVRCKTLADHECYHYFDNRILEHGVQPLQLYIQNDSDKYFVFTGKDISLPIMGKGDVGAMLYKNIVSRSFVWGFGALFYWPAFIPILLVDGILCLQANKEIGDDITSFCISKTEKLVVAPHSRLHKVLFIQESDYHHHFTLALHEQESDHELVFRF
jgi:hypothetical protein